jgi:MFS superfamily sulfate permease-like transporter
MEAISWPSLDALGKLIEGSALGTAVAIAIIASAETLLSATAVDGMHTGARTRYNRELIAQGIGNSLCGLLGALPMTGVIVRSSVNVNAGAKTRLSTILHGLWILLFVAALPALLRWIPTSALAAMLVYTGFKLVDLKALRQLGAYGRTEIGIYLATVLGIIATNLLEGVLIGVGLAIVKLLFTFSHLEARVKVEDDGRRATLSLKGAASFVRLPQLAEALERVPVGAELHVKLDQLDFIDHACFELLESWEKQHHASGGRVVLEWEALHDLIRQHRPSTLREPV